MADAEDIADGVLKAIGGIGGAIVGVAGGGSEGAKATQDGLKAIRDIVGDATGRTKRKADEARADAKEAQKADDELERRRMALEERKLALAEQDARDRREKNRVRDFDAPMYPASQHRSASVALTREWKPTTSLNEDDRIVDIVDLPGNAEQAPPLVNDARDSVLLRRGDSRDVVLVDRGPLESKPLAFGVDSGPLVDGAQPLTNAVASTPAGDLPRLHTAPPTDPRFERAGSASPTLHNADAVFAARVGIDTERLSKEGNS